MTLGTLIHFQMPQFLAHKVNEDELISQIKVKNDNIYINFFLNGVHQ